MSAIDEKTADLRELIEAHFGYCQINRGRERLDIFYGEDYRSKKRYELNKASLEVMELIDVVNILKKEI